MDRQEAIKERAYHLWLDEGRPEGRETSHWELACELVAIEANAGLMLKPNPLRPGEEIMPDAPGEPLEVQENLGEFPTLTDQGEETTTPSRARGARQRATDAPVLAAADAPAAIDLQSSPAPGRRRAAKAQSS